MDKQIKLILEYQENDKKIKAIEDDLRKSEAAQKYFSAKKFLSTVNDAIANYDQKAKSVADSYNALKVEISKLEKVASEYLNAVDSCETEEELSYIKKKFQETSDAISNLENSLNSVYKEMEEIMKDFNKLRKETSFYQEQGKEFSPKYKDLKDEKDKEIAPIKQVLDKLEGQIDESLMNKYKAKRSDKKFPIVYKAVSFGKGTFNCPACGTETSVHITALLNNGEMVECESCRKLLYNDID